MTEESVRRVNAVEVLRGESFFDEGRMRRERAKVTISFNSIGCKGGRKEKHTRTESKHIRDRPTHPERQVELGTC